MLSTEESTFLEEGFLSTETQDAIPEFRDANADLFNLAEDVNRLLMRIAHTAMDTAKTNLQSKESVAVRLVLRAAGTFQGAVLLAESESPNTFTCIGVLKSTPHRKPARPSEGLFVNTVTWMSCTNSAGGCWFSMMMTWLWDV